MNLALTFLKKQSLSAFEVILLVLVGTLMFSGVLSSINPLECGLTALYFTNPEWRGEPVFTSQETRITLDRMARVFPQKTTDYSIQWIGFIHIPEDGNYQFSLVSDDGSSLFLDQQLLIDNGGFHGKQERSGQRYLTKGFHAIHINYMQGQGLAIFRAFWTRPGHSREPLSQAVFIRNLISPKAYWAGRGIDLIILLSNVIMGLCIVSGILLVIVRNDSALPRLRIRYVCVVIFCIVFITHFLWSDVTTSWDSKWSVHTALSILREGNTDLDEYVPVTQQFQDHTVVQYFGHTYNLYPIGTSLMALPVVWIVDVFMEHGWLLDTEQFINEYRLIPTGIEKCAASIIVALTTVLLYLISSLLCQHQGIAFVSAILFAFCTSAWSTASRALWQHGPTMLMLALTLYLFLLAERIPRHVPWALRLLSLPLAFSFVIRPTNALSIIVFSILMFIRYRKYFGAYCVWGLLVIVPFVVYNVHVYHALFPPYYLAKGQLGGSVFVFVEALVGTLLSPSRGLFVFSPILLFSVYGIVLTVSTKRARSLEYALISILLLHWILSALHPNWWGGHCYGPRYLSDILPYLFYFLPPVFQQINVLSRYKKWMITCLMIIAISVSFFIHLRGATNEAVYGWNAGPVNIDLRPSRVWDWRDAQFLRGL